MGICYNCKTQVTLQEEEIKCDSCGKILRYWCNSCKKPFDIINKELKKKLKDCKVCGFFLCPCCGECSEDCEKHEWFISIKSILGDDSNFITNIHKKILKICNFIEDIKLGKAQRRCPLGVHISYAKGRIKSLLGRLEGHRIKNGYDQEKFEDRLKGIEYMELNEEKTVENLREFGSYGQEYRDALNLSICMGLMKVTYKLTKDKKEFALFKRVDSKHCEKLDKKNISITECKKCKKRFSKGTTQCDVCTYKKKSKYHERGDPYETKTKLSNKDVCQLPRVEFIKKGEDVNH